MSATEPNNSAPAPPTAEKIIKTLEEDDEFEDFPDDTKWSNEAKNINNPAHLWEEDWEDDDSNDAFADRLREELKKAQKA